MNMNSIFAVVVIGFNQTRYDVIESVGQAFVDVVVRSGVLRRDVLVNFFTADNTAIGKSHNSQVQ